ncbi:MAG: metallophosphoesterase [Candidatus Bruticola sp.]
MKIAIISDSHDNLTKLRQAVQVSLHRGADTLVHAGDFVSPFSLDPLAEAKIPIHAVLGNNDGEREGLRKRFALLGAHFWEGPVSFYLRDTLVHLQHFSFTEEQLNLPSATSPPANAPKLHPELFICGHTHKLQIKQWKNCTLVNPGECCGYLTGKSTMVLYDTEKRNCEIITLD